MKKRFFLILLIPLELLLTSMGGSPTNAWTKENVSFPMMDLEINATLKENQRQKEIKKQQTYNAAVETVNRKQWDKYKEKVTKIQDRLRVVSFALQSVTSGVEISRRIKSITENQKGIINEIKEAPYLAPLALPGEYKFIDDAQMTLRLMVGIVVSYGAINQMEKAERKVLLDFAVGEVITLDRNSGLLLEQIKMAAATIRRNKNILLHYVNRDKQIVNNIMKNVKSF